MGRRIGVWLNETVGEHAPGLQVSFDKTKATLFRGEEQPLIRQARKMQRIQTAISGGFDAAGGEEVIQAVQGLVRSQAELALAPLEGIRALTPTPDVKDETLGRFAAGRFRKTYRSLRPLLESRSAVAGVGSKADIGEETFRRARMTQEDLDEEAHSFSLSLIGAWVTNPSHVRLLRVAVDLWPTRKVAETIILLLEQYLSARNNRRAQKVAFYCFSELLRAGATETGIVPDGEMLPAEADLSGYRDVLHNAAIKIIESRSNRVPWYLKQQALLFLLVNEKRSVPSVPGIKSADLIQYVLMKHFLAADFREIDDQTFAVFAVVARRSFLNAAHAVALVLSGITEPRFTSIAERDLEFARELFPAAANLEMAQDTALSDDLMISEWSIAPNFESLISIVKSGSELNALRNEIGLLTFAMAFLRFKNETELPAIVTPSNVQLKRTIKGQYSFVDALSVNTIKRPGISFHLYSARMGGSR